MAVGENKFYDGYLVDKSEGQFLKSYLEVKRQLTYCERNGNKALEEGHKEAHREWMIMVEAYSIALQIMEGKEL